MNDLAIDNRASGLDQLLTELRQVERGSIVGVKPIRRLLGDNIGATLTPELATVIELLANSASLSRAIADAVFGLAPEQVAKVALDNDQAPAPVFHRFGPGVYIRELHMKAGYLAVGHRHKKRNINQVLAGAVELFSDDGTSKIVRAPAFFVSEPGQKVGLVLEDLVWQNIIATDETDIEKIEAEFFEPSPAKEEDLIKVFAEKTTACEADRTDFLSALDEIGVSAEQVYRESVLSPEHCEFHQDDNWSVRVAKSPIHGFGLFATRGFSAGETICPALVSGKRTPAGRYVNHSANPNCTYVENGVGGLSLVAKRDIIGCRGGDVGEELTVCYREAYRTATRFRNKGETR